MPNNKIKAYKARLLTLQRLQDAGYTATTSYDGMHKKMTVRCPKGHDNIVTPSNFKRGTRCTHIDCGGIAKTLEDFITLANRKHDNVYTYAKTMFGKGHGKITITCPIHGDWNTTTRSSHLAGVGCPDCEIENKFGRDTVSLEEFITRSNKKHGAGKYDYSKVKMNGVKEDVVITCVTHSDFKQAPQMHMQGQGCPACANIGYQPSKQGSIYLVVIDDAYLGYGITGNLQQRIKEHTKNLNDAGRKHYLYASATFEDGYIPREIETRIKREFPKVDLEVEGFRTEATDKKHLSAILDIIHEYQAKEVING